MNEQPNYSPAVEAYQETRIAYYNAVDEAHRRTQALHDARSRVLGYRLHTDISLADAVANITVWLDACTAAGEEAKLLGLKLVEMAANGVEDQEREERSAMYAWQDEQNRIEREARAAKRLADYETGMTVSFGNGMCFWQIESRTENGSATLVRWNWGKVVTRKVSNLMSLNLHGVNDWHYMSYAPVAVAA